MTTLMGKGLGRIERAILAAFQADSDAFSTDELCLRAYPGLNPIERKHRAAVVRAANNLIRRSFEDPHMLGLCRLAWRPANTADFFFNRYSLDSYRMAGIKRNYLRWVGHPSYPSEIEFLAILSKKATRYPAAAELEAKNVLKWIAERDEIAQTAAVHKFSREPGANSTPA